MHDPGCLALDHANERESVECDNGLDDDGDSAIDFRPASCTPPPSDAQCGGVRDETEWL